MIELKFKLLYPGAKLPTRANPTDAGWDLYAPADFFLTTGVPTRIPLGLAWECPPGFFGRIAGRSGLAVGGAAVLGGVVDSSYRGEIAAVLLSSRFREFHAGDRIAQLLILPVPEVTAVEVSELSPSPRGGFGSSGA